MERRQFLKTVALSTGLLSTSLSNSCSALLNKKKPNILFLFADDMCHEALSSLGSEVKTPNLDRLAKSGTSFSNAYNMGAWNGAVCIASRRMLNTGRFLWNAYYTDVRGEQDKGNLWSQQMKTNGYDTYMAGKWHVDEIKAEEVFDVTGQVRPGMPNQTPEGYNRPKDSEDYKNGWKPWDKKYDGFWKDGIHWSEVLGNEGIGFLDNAQNSENPFFMYLAFNAPHDPRQSPKKYVDKYPLDEIDIPENYQPEYPYKNEMGCSKDLRDEALAPFPRTEYSVKVNRQEYYAIISHMDDQIGRVLDALEKSGEKDNTYIFFTADHGLAVGHHGLIGKQNMFEHSVKAPLIIAGPKIPKNNKIETPVYIQDIMPTTLELSRKKIPEYVQFKSLLPLINNKTNKQYEYIYGAYLNLQRMVRQDDYKLIYYSKIEKYLMFDLKNDPQEMKNLAEDKLFENRKQKLLNILDKADIVAGAMDLSVENLAKGASISAKGNPKIAYAANGLNALIDGDLGHPNSYPDGNWLGIEKDDLEVIIDLGKMKTINSVEIGLLENQKSWIFLPKFVSVEVAENDKFKMVKKVNTSNDKDKKGTRKKSVKIDVDGNKYRYIKVMIKNFSQCPAWHLGAGGKAWAFCDEITIE